MEFSFPYPMSQGEWLAFLGAAATALIGAFTMFAPGLSLRLLRLQTDPNRPEAIAGIRSTFAGFHLGLGLCCALFAQPFLYMALGICWLLTAFGRIISMMSDRAGTLYNWVLLVFEVVLGALPLLFALGLVP